ncbi:uncharacterized protein LOC111911089 [Lactuca sativa]|uniref:RRM domain-containing protein n=1 Tax=Lactuca sativa TaxID=4236 RepID=A0A9R1WZ23_LACSA|nr:uncharacterized protein LOC111911089 [Lactuca sativa]KAJ0190502.1 hypothetical protein LSAT_V11C800452440 [Lactuca sativa]
MNNGVLLKPNTLFQIPISPTSPLLHSNKTHHSFFSIQLPKHKLLSFHVKLSSGFPVFASKTSIKVETNIPETENSDFEDEFDEQFEEDDEDEVEDEDEEIFVPLKNMRQWTRNKPQGFGEGKEYDTSVEDKLLEELEQSRVAQLANVTNLKKNPEDGNPNSKKEKLLKQKVPEAIPNGTRVRLINLPKKKNIHRDLQAAFKPFSGIINIIPAVLGNEKTREPVCKGFAFVDFKSEKEANRFVDIISTEPITFGKVEKQIRCEIMKSTSPNPPSIKAPVHGTKNSLPITNPNALLPSSNPVTETLLDSYVEDAAFDTFKNIDENEDEFVKFDNVIQEKEKEMVSEPLKKVGEKEKKKKKKMKTVKKKVENVTKQNIPGSANRLKMKEKALLSGVFSKYGGKSAMVAKGTEVE